MHNSSLLSLLQNLRAHLSGRGLLRSLRRRRDPLLARLDAIVGQSGREPHAAIAIARTRLEGAPALRIDADEAQIEEAPHGVWVRGWIWVEQEALLSCDEGRMTQLRKALAELPPQTCAVFLAHCVEGLPYPEIAIRLDIEVAEVQRELAAALLALSAALDEA